MARTYEPCADLPLRGNQSANFAKSVIATNLKFQNANFVSLRNFSNKIEAINSLIATIEAKSELQAHILKSNFTLKKLSLIAEQSKKCE
ncbi:MULTISPECIES: hypothetical protein [unclassified Campylobacter]|uniref:hypothetical protein n=1 Tax=unclassified Campylobacter TaxID=2593542 RepID=UPI0022EA049E|nr:MULTISPECIES: hypothetical protein [unclassified Campylobacter]MDA3053736.1 hypothetical protein [Campylobacter sp. VBCF_07 NA4]MDA3060375.1 hypothetical protein [Campylobacter sp. VBCF_02 NA5]MDA3069885.1 hypothetical protein [Campylobacter sp. VBCF_08 NA3]WBR54788.1 hypothetical protein PF027_02660 [Campylobacter sp. VBCF_01 NA2]